MKTIIIVAAVLCAALVGTGVYLAVKPQPVGPRDLPIDQSYTDRVSKQAWIKGSATPTVTVTEYADYQCPYCMEIYSGLNAAIDATSSYAQLDFHVYPLYSIHNKAKLAAQAAESAGRQGKYWEMHDLLFSKQTSWENDTIFSFPNTLDGYAKDLQLNISQFDKDMKDPSVQTQIDADVALGDKIPVQGTPTLLINGKQVNNPPYDKDSLVKLIEAARDAKS